MTVVVFHGHTSCGTLRVIGRIASLQRYEGLTNSKISISLIVNFMRFYSAIDVACMLFTDRRLDMNWSYKSALNLCEIRGI